MSQQAINIGSSPNDGTGDHLRVAFDKSNDNFTELYKSAGASEGVWNFQATSTDTSVSPVSGRFVTNSGNYRDATQIAIHGTTIQGISRGDTLRKQLAGDIIQCQDLSNGAAWCRYALQSSPVDNGTWFRLDVALEDDGGVASGDNQEIVFVFTANKGGDLSAYAPLASPTFTGDPKAPTPAVTDNDTSIATTAFVKAQGYITSSSASASFQPLDAELTALAGTTSAADQVPMFTGSGTASTITVTSAARTVLDDASTGAMLTTLGAQPADSDLTALAGIAGVQGDIIYRDGSSWTRLGAGTSGQFLKTQGAGANPAWATLAGGGNVSNVGTPVDNQIAVWTAATTIEGDAKLTWDGTSLVVNGREAIGHTANLFAHQLEVHGLSAAVESITRWSTDVNAPLLALRKAKSGTVGTNGAVAANDVLGDIEFQPGYASGFGNGIRLRAVADDGVFGAPLTAGVHLEYWTAVSAGQTFSEKIRFYPSGGVDFDRARAGDPGTAGIKANWKGVTDGSDAPAGYVGEFQSATFTGVTFNNGVVTNLGSLSLAAGDWDVWVQFGGLLNTSASTQTYAILSVSATSAALDSTFGRQAYQTVTPNNFPASAFIQSRFSLTSTTTIYAVGQAVGTNLTANNGCLMAQRRR